MPSTGHTSASGPAWPGQAVGDGTALCASYERDRSPLGVPAPRAAGPTVLAGRRGLGRRVRWVHSAELADIAPLLRAGDLLLSTGIAMPDSAEDLERYPASLAESQAAGPVIELGRRWATVPGALVEACERLGLPLVALAREVRFAAVAQSVGERIVDEQLAELCEAQRVHDTFSPSSASPRPVPGRSWRRCSGRPGPLSCWRATGTRCWTTVRGPTTTPPSERLVAIAERGAAALACTGCMTGSATAWSA